VSARCRRYRTSFPSPRRSFLLAFLGYALVRWFGWPKEVSDALTKFVFAVAIPAVLFRLMSDFSRLPPVDVRLLIAYFGGCLLVFLLGRVIASRVFRMDGVEQSVFGVGGIFANNLLLGPSARDDPARRGGAAGRLDGARLQFAPAVDPRDGVGRVGAHASRVAARASRSP
jgi:predicted permease